MIRRRFFYERKNVSNTGFRRKGFISKEINDKIEKASFIDTIKPNEDKVF